MYEFKQNHCKNEENAGTLKFIASSYFLCPLEHGYYYLIACDTNYAIIPIN